MSTLPPIAAARGPFEAPAWRAVRPGVTAVLVFAMFLGLLFLLQIGSIGAAAGIGLAGLLAVLNRQALPSLFGARSFLFLIPALCIASAIWSEDPTDSFRSGLELAATVGAGLILSMVDRRREMLLGVVAAFAAYTVVALVLGHEVGVGSTLAAFSGLNSGKNFMAEIASTGALLSLGLILTALQTKKRLWLVIAVGAAAAALLELYVLYLARSAGAVIALTLAFATLGGLLIVARLATAWRVAVVSLAGIVLAILAAFHRAAADSLSSFAIQAFDKDPTLTGRTYLWYRAGKMIAEKPVLGRGYAAFWREGNPDAEGLWRFGGIDDKAGFNFHNTGVELLMQFGWIGALAVGAIVLVGAALLVRRFVRRPDAMTCLWLALTAFELTRAFYETIGPAPFYFSNILLMAAFGSAFRTPELMEPALPRRARG